MGEPKVEFKKKKLQIKCEKISRSEKTIWNQFFLFENIRQNRNNSFSPKLLFVQTNVILPQKRRDID